jgi:hypothetical protein
MQELAMNHERASKPWYRHFWVWFVISIPVAAMFMGFTTLYYAVSTSDGLVVDDYYKAGLAINRTLDRDRRAAELGLVARVSIRSGDEDGRIRVSLDGTRPQALRIRLLHPTLADQDVELLAPPDADGLYSGAIPALVPGFWHVLLEPAADADWRLLGRIRLPEGDFLEIRPPGS